MNIKKYSFKIFFIAFCLQTLLFVGKESTIKRKKKNNKERNNEVLFRIRQILGPGAHTKSPGATTL